MPLGGFPKPSSGFCLLFGDPCESFSGFDPHLSGHCKPFGGFYLPFSGVSLPFGDVSKSFSHSNLRIRSGLFIV
jgi:hypothetical protein